MESTYPFSEAARIEIVSYVNRTLWDSLDNKALVKEGVLNIAAKYIREKKTLNKEQGNKLFNYLFVEDCAIISSESKCYDPRHIVLFYNNEDKVFNHIEVCLECGNADGDFTFNEICPERSEALAAIFQDVGIKYFGEE